MLPLTAEELAALAEIKSAQAELESARLDELVARLEAITSHLQLVRTLTDNAALHHPGHPRIMHIAGKIEMALTEARSVRASIDQSRKQ